MAENITYLIGAGASANALPLTKTTKEALREFKQWLDQKELELADEKFPDHYGINQTKRKTQEDFLYKISCLIGILEYGKDCSSIDKYAQWLFRNNMEQELRELKATMSCYYLLEQSRKPVDCRYSDFFTRLKELIDSRGLHSDKLPGNIKIISWNYDLQFEKAFYDLYTLRNGDIYPVLDVLQVFPRVNPIRQYDENGFSIIKLNGTAGLHTVQKQTEGFANTVIENINDPRLREAILKKAIGRYGMYIQRIDELQPIFNFAFEQAGESLDAKNKALGIAEKTDVLVVIGYSFFEDNREVDGEILRRMERLRRIYVQNRGESATEKVREYLGEKRKCVDVIRECDVSSFRLPDELYES